MHVRSRLSAVLFCSLLGLGCSGKTDSNGGASGGAGGAGSGGTSGSAGAGGVPCPAGQKLCSDACHSKTDPTVGCSAAACDPCNLPNANPTCAAGGLCAVESCNADFADCNADAVDGCEANLMQDPHNCGVCGNDCISDIGANATCDHGKCFVMPSNCGKIGAFDCDGNLGNGCEVDALTDPANCGSCGNACASGESCVDGKCQ
jgi:hypothetical protein